MASKPEVQKHELLNFYVEKDNIVTLKEVEDWARARQYDLNKVRSLNDQLFKEGFLKKKLFASNQHFWLNCKDFLSKLEKSHDNAKQSIIKKESKRESKREQLLNEEQLRSNLEEQLVLKDQAKEDQEIIKSRQNQINSCIQDNIDDLEFRICVAINEAKKWTDSIYLAVQFMQQRSQNDVSYNDIQKTFPYLQNAECSVIIENEDLDQDYDHPLQSILREHDNNYSPPFTLDQNQLSDIQEQEEFNSKEDDDLVTNQQIVIEERQEKLIQTNVVQEFSLTDLSPKQSHLARLIEQQEVTIGDSSQNHLNTKDKINAFTFSFGQKN